jgi:hypothetical protein
LKQKEKNPKNQKPKIWGEKRKFEAEKTSKKTFLNLLIPRDFCLKSPWT